MANEQTPRARLQDANLVGWTIVKCDDQRCATCRMEPFGCKKLTMPGGQVCIWDNHSN